jgi:hypothetical protein
MEKHGRAFQCEPCRQIIIFFHVSDASPYIAAGAHAHPMLALQLLSLRASESMGNHDSNVVGAGRVG